VSLPVLLDYCCPSCLFQFYELGLEFNHGMCDNAGCQGCARGWLAGPAVVGIIDVSSRPEHAPRNICVLRHVVIRKSLNALNTGS